MVTKVSDTIKKNNMIKNGRVLVALSGGTDSSVLLDVLMRLRKELGISVCAAHLNHMLRGEDADSDEDFVRKKCKAYGIDLITEKADIAALAKESGESTELCARNVRYEFLQRAKKSLGATYIATAHNANDNLETILFNLLRGSGIDGMCGIPPVREDIVRPLIECTRREIEEYAACEKIDFCVDKTNEETDFSRNKLRHLVVPTLLEINSSAIENASRTSRILRSDSAFLKREAEKYAEKISTGEFSCDRKGLLSEPALVSRVCEFLATKALGTENYTLHWRHTEMICALAKSESPANRISLPNGLCVSRRYEELVFEKETEKEETRPIVIKIGENFWSKYKVNVKLMEKKEKIHNLLNTFFVPCDKIQGELVIRSRKEGDKIKLSGRRTKSLKKLFIDEKVAQSDRMGIPVIADSEKLFGVFGFGADVNLCDGSERGYFIEINEK